MKLNLSPKKAGRAQAIRGINKEDDPSLIRTNRVWRMCSARHDSGATQGQLMDESESGSGAVGGSPSECITIKYSKYCTPVCERLNRRVKLKKKATLNYARKRINGYIPHNSFDLEILRVARIRWAIATRRDFRDVLEQHDHRKIEEERAWGQTAIDDVILSLELRVNFLACQSGLRPRRMACFRRGRGFGCNHKPTPGISACKPFCRLGPPLCSKWLALTCRDVPGNVYFPIASKWRAQAILPDAIKMGVGAACDENSRDSGHYTINGIGVVGELDLHPGIRTCPMPSQAILPDAIKELAFWLAPA
ncbi:hypothetical protein DFH07DRAFT_944554 [Mycena maculata]|uniref:Uncharacterized protein n=1 Tax=Mycena maculata TaxID=230809 RepID=A0AAD7MWA1_9AGAR|nr:hypothetical protein DFH07DRAFT_944554 [Mycena maculata]